MSVINMDCIEGMRAFPDNSFDSIVTDPPYELGFMGKTWDASGIANNPVMWAEALRVLKPGGHLLAFSGSRTYHRMTCAIEDAGFEVRDQIMWVYGSGFPKSLDVSKAIDKGAPRVGMFAPFAAHYAAQRKSAGLTHSAICAAGNFFAEHNHGGASVNWEKGHNVPTLAQWTVLQPLLGLSAEWTPLIEREEAERKIIAERKGKSFVFAPGEERQTDDVTLLESTGGTDAARQWEGWGTALKPAHEPICVARKPLIGTVAANVLAHGTGALNIDGCRVGNEERTYEPKGTSASAAMIRVPEHRAGKAGDEVTVSGRWPANLIHSGCPEVLALFPDSNGSGPARPLKRGSRAGEGWGMSDEPGELRDAGTGSAARFFYCAKTSKADRGAENIHPTVKPTDLMAYLCRLVTPPGGVILDPFAGSGSTGKAAAREGFQFVGFELSAEYTAIANARIEHMIQLMKANNEN